MPFAIDEDKMSAKPGQPAPMTSLDPAKPPVKMIPHADFPRAVYKHPREPFKRIEHRNLHHEVVEIETLPAEHISKVVSDEKELKEALKQGWVMKPYVPQAPPDPNASLYEDPKAE